MRLNIGCWLLAPAFLCACVTQHTNPQAAAPAPTLSSLIDRIRPSVVLVKTTFPSGDSFTGSGFFINQSGDVVTAYHMIHPPGTNADPTGILVSVRIPTI